VYALRLGRTGGVAAYECEAQEGMHVHPGAAIEGDVASEPCPCGRPGPRLLWDPAAASCAAD
jgi:hypothetical protein